MRDKNIRTRTRPKSYLPEVKRKRIIGRHVAGQSYRDIASAEGVNKETVGRVLNLPESKEELQRLSETYTEQLQEELRALAPLALRAFRDAIIAGDTTAAWHALRGSGIAKYRDESKVQLSVDPYADWSQEDKIHFVQAGHRLSECTCAKSARECGELEEESVQ